MSISAISPISSVKINTPVPKKEIKSVEQIKSYLETLIINEFNIYYIDNDEPVSIANIPKIKSWGKRNKLFYEKDGEIVLNKKKLHFLQKQNNIHIKIDKTGNTSYSSQVDCILDKNVSFEYNMDILINDKVVYSMEIDSSSYQTNDLNNVRSNMFNIFNFMSDKCTLIILYLLS